MKTLLILALFSVSSACVRSVGITDVEFTSELENIDSRGNFLTTDSTYLLSSGKFKTDKASHSGGFSVRSTPSNAFVLSCLVDQVPQDSYVEILLWRKGINGHLVASLPDVNQYFSVNESIIADSSGWGLLKLTFYVPPISKLNKLKIYAWNSGQDTIYFDDLSVKIESKKRFPNFSDLQPMHLEIDTTDMISLLQTRKIAFERGILISGDDDWVGGFLMVEDTIMQAKLRLKGDWLDHLRGTKWSYRVKLKKGSIWNRMKVFSLQNPMARMGVNEWFLHQLMISEGLLTTRYGFIPLIQNGQSKGLYAWEEHFVKQLIESQNKREGPIVRFQENALWDTRVMDETGKRNFKTTPIFDVAVIEPFSQGKLLENPVQYDFFLVAQNLMFQYKNGLKSASDIFNTETLAMYFALADVFMAKHGIIWHNQRFYYNPVLCKLEPIAFDCYSDIGVEGLGDHPIIGFDEGSIVMPKQFFMVKSLFKDSLFSTRYYYYLNKYSSKVFLDSVFNYYNDTISYYDSLISLEYPDAYFLKDEIFGNAELIRSELPALLKQIQSGHAFEKLKQAPEPVFDSVLPEFFAGNLILAYRQQSWGDSCEIRVKNYYTESIHIIGSSRKKERLRDLVFPIVHMNAFRSGQPYVSDFTVTDSIPGYIIAEIGESGKQISIPVLSWPEPEGKLSPLQQLSDEFPFPDNEFIEQIVDNDVWVREGNLIIDHPVIIPAGVRLHIRKGTIIDMVNNAMIISQSPVFINGTSEMPVVISSSDQSSNGFAILQTIERSYLQHVSFENLNTLNYNGWHLTGGVTFYEAPVDLEYVRFYRNHCEDALNIVRSSFSMNNCHFEYIYADAFDSDFSWGNLNTTDFIQIGNDAIDFSGSKINISNVNIKNAMDKGISGGEDSHLVINDVEISQCNIGIASKDLSELIVESSSVDECNYGLVLLQKKPEYGPSKLIFNNSKIDQAITPMLIEENSLVLINGDSVKGVEKNVAKRFY